MKLCRCLLGVIQLPLLGTQAMPLVIIQLVAHLPYTACGPEIQNNITITDVVSVCVLACEFQVPECAGRIG